MKFIFNSHKRKRPFVGRNIIMNLGRKPGRRFALSSRKKLDGIIELSCCYYTVLFYLQM